MKNKKIEHLKEEYLGMDISKEGAENMKEAIERAKRDKKIIKRKKIVRNIGLAAAAAVAITVGLPNISENAAMAMERIPLIGSIVPVVTGGKYQVNNQNYVANIENPSVKFQAGESNSPSKETKVKESEAEVNKEIQSYTNRIKEQFQKEMKEENGNLGVDVSYEVAMDTDKWFTLKVSVLEVRASGYEYNKYYHINKMTGEMVSLEDLFQKKADYKGIISEEIKSQMREQMKASDKQYNLDGENGMEKFTSIKNNQNFYFNQDNQLVIVFDEYEVAPGYMGCPEFVIPSNILNDILK